MPGDSHKVDKILEFAKIGEEAEFQRHHPYSFSKARKTFKKVLLLDWLKDFKILIILKNPIIGVIE